MAGMRVRDRAARWVAGLPGVREAVYARADLTVEDVGWRPSGAAVLRDVTLTQHLDNIKDSEDAYRVNPLAYRIVELATDYVLGKGMALRAKTDKGQRFVAEWWKHPMNRMATRQFELMTELTLVGELFVTLHTNPVDGMTYLRVIPGSSIDQIEVSPDDLEAETRFHRAAVVSAWDGITWTGETDTMGRWWEAADCRHYAVNRLVGGIRGQGDLVPMLPWLRRYKDWLTDRVRINKFKGAYLWDITIKGGDRRAIERRKQELGEAPTPGSAIVHNESEEWKAVQPQIASDTVEADGRAIRLMVAAGAGIPLHFLAEPEGTSKATAAEMGGPTFRHYARRQLYFGWLMCDLAAECGRRYGLSASDVELEAEFEDLTSADNVAVATGAQLLATALQVAEQQGWMSKAEAAELFGKFCQAPLSVGARRERPGRGSAGGAEDADGGRGTGLDGAGRRSAAATSGAVPKVVRLGRDTFDAMGFPSREGG